MLNSIALMERGIERMSAMNIERIHGYLDHDEAGRAGLALLAERGAWKVSDASSLYAGFKDANELIA